MGQQYSPRFAFWQTFKIPDRLDPSRTYLKRLRIVQTPWFGVYLHWIYLPDNDRDPHDHPWSFASLILRGGYNERRYVTRLTYRDRLFARFRINQVPITEAHQIVDVLPGTVTLVFVGRRRREWGFWTETGFVSWLDYDKLGEGPDPFMGPEDDRVERMTADPEVYFAEARERAEAQARESVRRDLTASRSA